MTSDGFSKIHVDTVSKEPMPAKKRKIKPAVFLLPLLVVIIALAVVGVMLLPLRSVVAKAQELGVVGRETADALKSQDLAKTKEGLVKTHAKFAELSAEYAKVKPLKFVPFLGAYIADGEHGIKAGEAALTAADKAIEALEPNADLLGFTGGGKFVQGSADERIQVAVRTMNALTPKITEMSQSIDIMRQELDQIEPDRYPSKIGDTVIRDRLVAMKELVDNSANLFVNAQPLLVKLPSILGEPQTKRYLVLFQNDKELRATGGFLTAFAQFRFEKGKIILEKSDDIYTLDAALRKKYAAPREILTFHKDVFNLHIRDSNLSPDFPTSMKQFEEMYTNTSGAEKIDGIIAVDTHVLVEALKILGPETIGGRVFSADIDKRCDCPRAVYELEDYSTRPVNYVRTDRKDIIGILLQQLMQKALGVSPSQYWGRLFQMFLDEVNQKHVITYFKDPETQRAAENFNMAGTIMAKDRTASVLKYTEGPEWDYLTVVNANMAGAKSNMFVNETITKDVTVNGDGTVTTKLTVEYKNPYAGSDCNLERGGLCLNAPLRNWVRVYVPAGSTLKESRGTISPKSGSAAQMETYTDLGKTVFEGFLVVNPKSSSRLELTYTSPVKTAGSKYQLLIQKQPGTDGQEWTVKVGGREKFKGILVSDTELVL